MSRALLIVVAAITAATPVASSVQADLFEPTDDAYTVEPNGGSGTGTKLETRNRYGADGPGYEVNTHIKFDLSAIPPSAEVTSASLRMYYYEWRDTNPLGRELTAYRVEGAWEEETITWDTQPPEAETPTAASSVPAGYGWMEWDVAVDVQAFVDGTATNCGWKLMDTEAWNWFDIPVTRFYSRKNGNPGFVPYPEVEYTQGETCWYEYGERYSIIVMGGNEVSGGQLYRWYWGDTHGMYTQLKDIGFTDENIYFLSYGDSADAYPHHVDATSTTANIRDAYAWAANACAEDDLLYIYWVDHGSQTYFNTHGGTISHTELGTLTDAITAKTIIGAYNPCYSGCVIDDLSRPGVITVTSQDCTHTNSWGWAGMWRRALRGAPEDSIDTNGDGHISMTEAYEWICPRSQDAGEHSMYDDDGDGSGHECTDPGFDRNDPARDGYFGRHYALDGWAVCLVAVEEPDLMDRGTTLLSATPNPFGQATTLRFALPSEGLVYIDVFSVDGRKVANPREGFMEAGVHTVPWQGRRNDGARLESGMYYVRLITDRDVRTQRVCLLR